MCIRDRSLRGPFAPHSTATKLLHAPIALAIAANVWEPVSYTHLFFVLNLFAGIKNNTSNKQIYGNLISPINTPVAK